MKYIYTIILSICTVIIASGQCAFQILETQAEVDAFPVNYPNCIEVPGLRIEGDDIIDLSPLNQLTTITGALSIRNCSILENLDGLESLIFIEETIAIDDNPSLKNIDALRNVGSVLDNILIRRNSALIQLDGLEGIAELTDLQIFSNHSLNNIDGLNNISINNIAAEISVLDNISIASIPAFPQITRIGSIGFGRCHPTISVNSFNNVVECNIIWFNEFESLTDLQGFNSISSDSESINISDNPNLLSIELFNSGLVNNLGSLRIDNNPLLNSVIFVDRISAVDQSIIRNNISLSDCNYMALCDWASISQTGIDFTNNSCGCSSRAEVLDVCSGVDPCDCGDPIVDHLKELYNSTNGPQWTNNDGWLVDCDYCNWEGITCDANQNIALINLSNNNLTGSLPSYFGDFPFLIALYLSENSIGGMIPDFSGCTNLEGILLNDNQLVGNVPSNLDMLPLTGFSVINNNLSGCFDDDLAPLCSIGLNGILSFDAGNNFDITWDDFCNGSMCCAHPDLAGLQAFYDSTNGDMWTNTIDGIDIWFEDCDPCGVIDGTPWHGLSCDIFDRVIIMSLNANNLSGDIPDDINLVSELVWFVAFNNNLTGSPPASLCDLPLLHFQAGNNNLGGNIPLCLTQLPNLTTFVVGDNNFVGQLPPFSSSIEVIRLGNNNFDGTIPASYGLFNLTELELYSNNLTGCYPIDLQSHCSTIQTNDLISDGNNLNATWEDFCLSGAGTCTVSTINLELSNAVSVYPNPFSQNLQISSSHNSKIEYRLFTTGGKLIAESFLEAGTIETIDTYNISNGLYLLRILDGEDVAVKRIIKI